MPVSHVYSPISWEKTKVTYYNFANIETTGQIDRINPTW